MTSAFEKLDATSVKITVSLTAEEIQPAFDHALEHIGRSVQLPGFRKGKVPAKLLEQRIGKGEIIEHAVNEGVPGWYGAAIEELDLRPYGQPEIEVTKIPGVEEGFEGLEFTAVVDVRPEIALPAADTFTVEVEPAEVTDEDVDGRLTALRERFGSLKTVDRAAAEGDYVTLDLSAELDGAEVDAIQGTSYQVGSASMLDGLDDAITGLAAGASATFKTSLAAGEHKGADAQVSVTVTAVKTRDLPAADDEFAQLASEFDTIDELMADLREQVGRIKANNQAVEARGKLLEAYKEAAGDFPLPTRIIEREVHTHLENESRLEDDEHRAEVTEQAKTTLRDQIVLDQLAEEMDVDVSERELVDYMVNASRQYGMDPNTFIQQIQRAGQIPVILADVARSKATTAALRRATVKDTAGKVVDLSAVIGTVADEASEETDAE